MLLHDPERQVSNSRRLRAVRDGGWSFDGYDLPPLQGALGVVPSLRLHTDHPAARHQLGGREGAPSDESPAPDANEQVVEFDSPLCHLLAELLPGRTLSRDHVPVIVRRYERRTRFVPQLLRYSRPILLVPVVKYHVGSVPLRRVHLDLRSVLRHYDGALHPQNRSAQRDRLRVIAAREGNDARLPLLGTQMGQGVVPAAKFERTHPLQVLAFDVGGNSEVGVEGAAGFDGGDARDAAEDVGRLLDVAVRGEVEGRGHGGGGGGGALRLGSG
mmetsp:Transcript_25576/g.52349  ORF Transcript_25576/g.52349 Transcript_25576/m.52349 type:complete len:272 (+) Transcript_25576:311-1126(+)